MDRIRNKLLLLQEAGPRTVITVAVLCILLAVAVFGVTMAQQTEIADSYRSGFRPAVISDERALLAFSGDDPEALIGKLNGVPVTVIVDGQPSIHTVSDATVAEVLRMADVTLGEYDRVTPSLNKTVEEFDEIIVTRCERELFTEEEDLPFETLYLYSPQVTPGTEVVQTIGSAGVRQDTWAQFYVHGILDEEELIETRVVREPVDEVILMGFQSRPVSGLDFQAEFDENGEPLNYSRVLRSSRAAGYSAPAGAGTASGMPARVGHVAVNPNVIPYGSRLFIQSTDGSFVYGYAIAADTGTALHQGLIEVDLFYDTYAASANNGIKTVDIFILEE